MAKYTYAQLEGLWIQAGGNKAFAPLAAAIAMAESAGNSSASNHNSNGSIDRGLWQINSVHGSLSTFDPLANAKAAVKISSNGKNWHPWVTYNSGAYKKFLKGNVPPGTVSVGAGASTLGIEETDAIPGMDWLGKLPSTLTGAASGIGDIGTGLGHLATAFGTLEHWIAIIFTPGFWLRIGAFTAGMFFFLFSLYFLKGAI